MSLVSNSKALDARERVPLFVRHLMEEGHSRA